MTHHSSSTRIIRVKDTEGMGTVMGRKVRSAFLNMKRRLHEPRVGRRDEGAAATEPRTLAGRVFVAQAAGEGGRRVLNHAKKTVGELVQSEVYFASIGRVVIVVVVAAAVRG